MSSVDPEDLADLGASCLGDSGGRAMAAAMGPAYPGARVVGRAYTVLAGPGDNLALHVACAEAPPGSVLVVDASAAPDTGYWGEVLTTGAEARGILGLVIEGGVRDVQEIAGHGFGLFSTLVAHRQATKTGAGGAVGGSVVVGGVTVDPGDWVVGDADGVTVVPAVDAEAVVAAAKAKALKEAELFEELRAGETTIDLLGLDPSPITRR